MTCYNHVMKIDAYGQRIYTEADLCNMYMVDPDRILTNVLTDTQIKFDDDLELTNKPETIPYVKLTESVAEFDSRLQTIWHIPKEYANFDIAAFVINLCETDEELQRVGTELLMYQERNMFGMLIYLKYLVDTMRKHNVVWGVGRGSSVASFVLYLIGIHRIDSLFYQLPIEEFLK